MWKSAETATFFLSKLVVKGYIRIWNLIVRLPIISLRTATSNRQERTFYLLILLEIVISAERPAVVCLLVMFRFIRVVVFGLLQIRQTAVSSYSSTRFEEALECGCILRGGLLYWIRHCNAFTISPLPPIAHTHQLSLPLFMRVQYVCYVWLQTIGVDRFFSSAVLRILRSLTLHDFTY